ncbi:MAG: hypothetical protein PHP30_09450 [Bacteroidales bacterium]|nr:hypothetical protein [Bacteroidales bacterium]
MKKDKELAQLRKLLKETELLRFQTEDKTKIQALETASVELRDRERLLIKEMGDLMSESIEIGGKTLNELATRIRKKIEKMGRLPKKMDKISKIILQLSEIADDIREKSEKF